MFVELTAIETIVGFLIAVVGFVVLAYFLRLAKISD